jgi:hypothetical protein
MDQFVNFPMFLNVSNPATPRGDKDVIVINQFASPTSNLLTPPLPSRVVCLCPKFWVDGETRIEVCMYRVGILIGPPSHAGTQPLGPEKK